MVGLAEEEGNVFGYQESMGGMGARVGHRDSRRILRQMFTLESMRNIPLTKGRYAIVDDQDYDELRKTKWHLLSTPTGHNYAAHRKYQSKVVSLMHREITNAPPKSHVDHINHDTLDNRRENLRVCTVSQNVINSAKPTGRYSSRYKGVSFDKKKKNNVWRACIWKDNTFHHIGNFLTEIDAAEAYNKRALELFGEFAYLNPL